MKLLLAEDTKDLNQAVTFLLEHELYEVDCAYDGAEALDYLQKDSYDCILLDIMMPKIDGLTVLKEIRARHILTPVLMLTARSEVDDRILGLDTGADDYLTKPFASRELLARIRALIRRSPVPALEMDELHFGDITLLPEKSSLAACNSVHLSGKELELMILLMSNSDLDLSTSYLLDHVWKSETDAHEDIVWLYISYLKRKLFLINSSVCISGEKGGSFRLIEAEHQ